MLLSQQKPEIQNLSSVRDNFEHKDNNNNIPVAYKYWVGIQWVITMSHGQVELFNLD